MANTAQAMIGWIRLGRLGRIGEAMVKRLFKGAAKPTVVVDNSPISQEGSTDIRSRRVTNLCHNKIARNLIVNKLNG